MFKKLIHTPEGVRDLYDIECAKKETIKGKILRQIHRYGYRDIQTPSFEFFDIFSKEKGSVSPKEMFMFFDRNGETLVLRPDITPSIARAAAKYYMDEEMPIRLSYCGNTYMNHGTYQGRLNEQTQIGAELIGDSSPQADAEMIVLMVRALESAGLQEFRIELGNVDFFYGFLTQLPLEESDIQSLKVLIDSKNSFGVEELLNARGITGSIQQTILKLPELFGGYEILAEAEKLANNEISSKAICRLKEVYQILASYQVTDHIYFDLGMIGKYQYYTGVIYRGITYGSGESIVTGGRYDNLLAQYGKNSCSIGFAIRLDLLLTAMERQKLDISYDLCETLLLYEESVSVLAIQRAEELRSHGIPVSMMLRTCPIEDYLLYAKRNHYTNIFYLKEENMESHILLSQKGE